MKRSWDWIEIAESTVTEIYNSEETQSEKATNKTRYSFIILLDWTIEGRHKEWEMDSVLMKSVIEQKWNWNVSDKVIYFSSKTNTIVFPLKNLLFAN